jgi:hypothetical protein
MNGARGFLIKAMLTMLTRPVEDYARYNAQVLEPVEFLGDVAGHILSLEPHDVLSEADIVQAVISVAAARDALQSEKPQTTQLVIPWRAWLHDGVRIQ